jgi:rubrerythrin
MAKARRTTQFWLEALERRRTRIETHAPLERAPIEFQSEEERIAAVRFFNAALRAEESGYSKASELSARFQETDPDLSRVLALYGKEEAWHHDLITELLPRLGGEVSNMGKVTRTFYRLYGRAKSMDTILLTNLMFETIGASTYRLALSTVKEPTLRSMLQTLAQDEAFHVPLNVHFLREVACHGKAPRWGLRLVFRTLHWSLLLLPWASRPKARAFDQLGAIALSKAYAEALHKVFDSAPELGLRLPRWPERVLGWAESQLGSPAEVKSTLENPAHSEIDA